MNSKTRTQEYSKVDRSKGEYQSLRWLIKKEGLVAALSYAQKCLTLGGDWVEFDTMWEHDTYLVLRHQYQEELKHAWKLCSQSSGSSKVVVKPDKEELKTSETPQQGTATADKSEKAEKEGTGVATPPTKPTKAKKGDEAGTASARKGTPPPAKKAKTTGTGPDAAGGPPKATPTKGQNKRDPLKNAIEVKKRFGVIIGAGHILVKRVESCEDWQYLMFHWAGH